MTNSRYPRLYMTLESGFTGIRCLEHRLIPVRWSLYVDLLAIKEDDHEGPEESSKASIKWQSLNFWVNQLLADTIVYSVDDNWAQDVIFRTQNPAMTVPGTTPTDDVMVQVLFEKINAICEGALEVIRLSLSSSDIGAIYHVTASEDESTLPDISYVGKNVHTLHSKPWWERMSSDCCDVFVTLDEETEENDTEESNITQLNLDPKKDEKDILEEFEERLYNTLSNGTSEYVFDDESSKSDDNKTQENEEDQKEETHVSNVIEPKWPRKK